MKKFKGFIDSEEESYAHYRAKLKEHGASQIKGKEPDAECEFNYVHLTFKANFAVARRLLLDEGLSDIVSFKDFPMHKLVKLSNFNNIKIIQHSEFNPMLHYNTDSRIGWQANMSITTYISTYSQHKKRWNESLKRSGFASAEYVCVENSMIRLYGYNTIHELYPYMIRKGNSDGNFWPIYYLDKTNVLQTVLYQSVVGFINANIDIALDTFGKSPFTQLIDEQIKHDLSCIPELMKEFNQSGNYDSNKYEFSRPLSQIVENPLSDTKEINHILINMEFVELAYEDKHKERFLFGSKRLCTYRTTKHGRCIEIIEHFIAMRILQSVITYFRLPY